VRMRTVCRRQGRRSRILVSGWKDDKLGVLHYLNTVLYDSLRSLLRAEKRLRPDCDSEHSPSSVCLHESCFTVYIFKLFNSIIQSLGAQRSDIIRIITEG
jgi:hypothetical protein